MRRMPSLANKGREWRTMKSTWFKMVRRCQNPKDEAYPAYGGRGIKVCERWAASFASFMEDMGTRPSPKHTLDRKDNNAGYCPENCRWATGKEQARNRRTNALLTAHGRTMCVAAWAEESGTLAWTIYARIRKGESPESAIFRPLSRRRKRKPDSNKAGGVGV